MKKRWVELPRIEPPTDLLDWLQNTYLDDRGKEVTSQTGDPGLALTLKGAGYSDQAVLETDPSLEDKSQFAWQDSLPLSAQKGIYIVAQTLGRRGIHLLDQARSFLDPSNYQPSSPYELPGMQLAVECLLQAFQQGETILVWGDFDVDGQTSTSLLVSALRQLGGKVLYHIPVRENESHGVSITVLRQILEENRQEDIRVLLTCDTGISANEAITYANQQGLKVLVTDHHELPPVLPEALAIVNPNFLPAEHPLHSLPGVGVAYKLAQVLFAEFGRAEEVEQFLDLAALGCVADVAQLTGETRYLVQRGLKLLSERKRLGLRLMMESASIPQGKISEEQIGFILAPRLNALGRLDDSNPVVEFLVGEDEGKAQVFVARLEALNARRQLLTSQTLQGALAQIEREPALLEDPILVLAHPAWPPGVIGIVASRLVEQFAKPVILLAALPGEAARGSARSVNGFDITEALRWVEAQARKDSADEVEPLGLFYGFGGHAMAAGMSLAAERIPELRRRLRLAAELQEIPQPVTQVDAYLDFSELSFELADQLERLAPYGAGNPALLLASKNLVVQQTTRIGRNQEHMRLRLQDENGQEAEVLWWQAPENLDLLDFASLNPGKVNLRQDLSIEPNQPISNIENTNNAGENLQNIQQGSMRATPVGIDLAYQLRTSSYRGQRQLQLTWVDYRPSSDMAGKALTIQRRVFDCRQEQHPLPVLVQIVQENPDLVIWAEGEAVQPLRQRFSHGRLVDRYTSQPAPALVIWTPPCSRSDLQRVLEAVMPGEVYFFNLSPGAAQPVAFLQRLAGLVKFALRAKQGQVELEQLAVATGQNLLTVRLGLDWLAVKGHIMIEFDEGQHLLLSSGDGVELDATTTKPVGSPSATRKPSERLAGQIAALLDETKAYRNYYARMPLDPSRSNFEN